MRYLFQKKNLTFLWIAVFLIGGFFVFTNGIFASSAEVLDSSIAENQVTAPAAESTEPTSVITEATPVVDVISPIEPVIEPVVETTEAVITSPVVADPIETEITSTPILTEEVIIPEVLTEAPIKPEATIVSTEATATTAPTPAPAETWSNNGSKFITVSSVELNRTYIAPQNNQVTVTFTKLPENPGTLSIEEITLTSEQIALLGALSDKAYDITSDMVDGTFEFDLTLPKPVSHESAEIKFAETISDLKNAETVAGNEIKLESDSIKASFNHFTIYAAVSSLVKEEKKDKTLICVKGIVEEDSEKIDEKEKKDKKDKCDSIYSTIQEAIDVAKEGDIIKVYPGNYNETALNRALSIGGTYQFGLFVGTDKNNITIEGVNEDGAPITDATNLNLPYITTNATNNFGYSGIFIAGNNVTISGVHIGPNSPSDNKTIEVIGDNFTLQYSKTSITGGGSVYINDFSTEGNIVKSYHIIDNIFNDGTSVDIASGAGLTGSVSDREILRNKFDLGNNGYNAISFNGAGGAPWYAKSVGGAVISGNEFKNSTQYIRARGVYDNSQFDWKSYWDNNTFDKKVVTLSDLTTFAIQPFSYDNGEYTFTNVRRIGALIQSEINNAQAGNIINIGQGEFIEQINIDKNLTLLGDSADKTIIKAPAVMVKNSFNQNNIVEIKNSAITNISNITVSGPGSSNCGSMNNGLYIIGNATLNISDSKISNIKDSVFSGCQNGVAIRAGYNAEAQSGHLIIDKVIITDYQKGGIVIDGLGSTATITNNIVTGAGNNNITAQNGIQISRGATATLSGNTITGNSYNLDSNVSNWGATGILLYQSGPVTMTGGNKIFNNDLNIDKLSSGSLVIHGDYIGASTAPVGVGAGISNEDSDLIDATNNWWGDQSGPYDIIANDGSTPASNNGLGSAAMGAINYGYWCTTSDCITYYDPVLAAPINLTPVNDTYTNNPSFDNTWSPVSRAIGYEYRTSYSINGENLGGIIYSDSSISKPERYNFTDTLITRHNIDAPDATYYWQVRAISIEGTENPWSEIKKVTVDKTAPSVPANGQPNDQYKLSNEFDFTWEASSDNLSGPVTYEFQSTKSPLNANGVLTTGLWKSPNPLTSAMIHSSGASNGTWYWQVRAVDKAGNKSIWSPIWKMTIDSLIPNLAITSPTANQNVKGSVITIKGTATDDNFNYYYCYITGANGEIGVRDAKCETAWWAGAPFRTAFAETINGTTNSILGTVTLNNVANGNYTVHLVGKDKAGNSAEITQPFVLDNTKPVISFVAPEIFTTPFKVGPTVKVEASDNNGLSILVIHVYDGAGTLLRNSCTATATELAAGNLSCDLSNLAEGTYYIKAGTNDKAGNNTTITSEKFVIDNTAPTVSLIFPTPGPEAKSFQAVFNEDVDAIDATNPANYFLSNWPGAGGSGDLVGGAVITYDTVSKTATISFTNPDWYISAEQQWGVQNIHDLAGNIQEPILVASYSTPMLAPVTTINLTGTVVEDIYTSSVTVALNATDGDVSVGSGVKATYYSINDSVFTAGTSALIETNGDYNIRYYSEDNAGNIEAEKNITFKINISNNNEDTSLADAKRLALEALAQAFATYTNTDYTDENWLILTGFNANGIIAINAATTVEEVASAKANAINGMAGVEKKQEQPARIITTNFGGGGSPINYCSNVEYGEWGTAVNGIQQRGILSRTPSNCSLSPEQQLSMTRPLPVIQQVLGEKKYADGTLLKGTNNRIYVVIGGKLLYITNFKELAKYHGPILKVSDEIINSFAKASVLGVKKYADGTLIRAKGDIKVYVIKNGKKVQIKTLIELRKYKGVIYTVTSEELNNY